MTDTAAVPTGTRGLRIGTAPDSWGVWFPDDPRQTPWQRFLDEAQAAGYHWIELGPYGYLPTDPHQLQDELGKRDLELSAGTVFTGFHKGEEQWQRAWDQAVKVAGLAHALGAEHIIVIPDLWRSDATGETLEARTLTAEQWEKLAAGHDRLGKALLEDFGVHQQFHSHADSHVGTYREVEKLLELTDPRYLNLCLDTGHFAYYGGDSVKLIKAHPSRIGYLIDMAPKELEKVLYFAASMVTWVDEEARDKDVGKLEKEVKKVVDSYEVERQKRTQELNESLERRVKYLEDGDQAKFDDEDHIWADSLKLTAAQLRKLKDDERGKMLKELRKQFDAEISDTADIEVRARRLVEHMALVLQGSLLVRFAPSAVADAFCASRLGNDWGHAFGTLPSGVDTAAIVERATPKVG